MTRSIRTLLANIVDYAGLFPPATLAMPAAVETFARARAGEHAWMLGRFVCPAERLEELSAAASALMPGTYATSGYRERADSGEPWGVGVLVDASSPARLEADLARMEAFNRRHSSEDAGLALADVVEVRVNDVRQIDAVIDALPEEVFPFFEFPVTTDCRGFVAALAGNTAGAKIRTGGVVGNAFPTADEVSEFVHACAAADVPFKATAGLHHPVRGNHPLTYEPGSASCVMHGFLNLFVAAVLAQSIRPDQNLTRQILAEEDPAEFRFSEEVMGWREFLAETAAVARSREGFALSFGSCSFDEPVRDLARLGLL